MDEKFFSISNKEEYKAQLQKHKNYIIAVIKLLWKEYLTAADSEAKMKKQYALIYVSRRRRPRASQQSRLSLSATLTPLHFAALCFAVQEPARKLKRLPRIH